MENHGERKKMKLNFENVVEAYRTNSDFNSFEEMLRLNSFFKGLVMFPFFREIVQDLKNFKRKRIIFKRKRIIVDVTFMVNTVYANFKDFKNEDRLESKGYQLCKKIDRTPLRIQILDLKKFIVMMELLINAK
ncbi:MAG: hypothetical protein PHE43_04760 [Candidatus Nanoarchaeia archaeon]|nr:hypothetical protein [Candidatus Nanoarchaeia archaeon]